MGADFICIPVPSRGMTCWGIWLSSRAQGKVLDSVILKKEAPCAHSHLQTAVRPSGEAYTCKSHISVSKCTVWLGSPDMHIGGNSGQVHEHRAQFQPQAARGQFCGQLWDIQCCIRVPYYQGIVPVLPVGLAFSLGPWHPAQNLAQDSWEGTFAD